VLLSRSQDKSDALSWDSILHGIQDMPSSTQHTHSHLVPHHARVGAACMSASKAAPAKGQGLLVGGVMWDGSDGEDLGPPPLRSFFGHPSAPATRGELDFHAFIQEGESSDEEIHVADGEFSFTTKRRKVALLAPASTAQIQAKKAKLAALREANQQPLSPVETQEHPLAASRPESVAGDEGLLSTETPEGKRHTHNVLERKRREDLKVSYQELRLQVPELISADRAPTGQILIKAADYIAKLKAEEEAMLAQLTLLRAQNANLQRLRHGVVS